MIFSFLLEMNDLVFEVRLKFYEPEPSRFQDTYLRYRLGGEGFNPFARYTWELTKNLFYRVGSIPQVTGLDWGDIFHRAQISDRGNTQ